MKLNSLSNLFILIILNFCIYQIASEEWYQRGNPHFINQQQFHKLVINPQTRNNGVSILKFFTPWCRYCKFLKDIIDELKVHDTWNINVYQVNCDGNNHHFCGQMGVRSYPKMSIFQNGAFQQSMDGFYPYPVVRQLFVKYNRTAQVQQPPVQPQPPKQQPPKEEHKQPTPHVNPNQQKDYVEPQIIPVQTFQDNQPIHQQKPANPSQPENHIPQTPKHQQPKPVQYNQNKNHQQAKIVNPVEVKEVKPPTQNKKQQTIQKSQQNHNQKVQQKPTQASHNKNKNMKKTEQMIEQEQNIAIVDQNQKQIQSQKKIIEESQKSISSMDLTHLLPSQQHTRHYGKYIIYSICIIVGFYYFVHIMKAEPSSQSAKHNNSNNSKDSYKKTSDPHISNKISIQDSQLRQQLNFQHPNQQQVNINSVQIRDQDL